MSWSSLQPAIIEFLARRISSKLAPSETPNSFNAFSTDISNGAESSAREPAKRTPNNVRRLVLNTKARQESFFNTFPIWVVFGRRAGRREYCELAESRRRTARLGRTQRAVAICCFVYVKDDWVVDLLCVWN